MAKLDRSGFLTKLLRTYGGAFKGTDAQEQRQAWVDTFLEVLEENIDYSLLWGHFLREFDCSTINAIPSAQWLYKESRRFVIRKECEALTNIRNLPKGDPPPPEFYKKMAEIRAKTSIDLAI